MEPNVEEQTCGDETMAVRIATCERGDDNG